MPFFYNWRYVEAFKNLIPSPSPLLGEGAGGDINHLIWLYKSNATSRAAFHLFQLQIADG